jgi:hypothetical protein
MHGDVCSHLLLHHCRPLRGPGGRELLGCLEYVLSSPVPGGLSFWKADGGGLQLNHVDR